MKTSKHEIKKINMDALTNVIEKANFYLNRKYENRKRLNSDEVWEKATTIRDIYILNNWIKEKKEE